MLFNYLQTAIGELLLDLIHILCFSKIMHVLRLKTHLFEAFQIFQKILNRHIIDSQMPCYAILHQSYLYYAANSSKF